MSRDGKLVPDVAPYRRMANILFPRRNDAAVYFEDAVDVTHTLAWLDVWNAAGRPKLTLFTLWVFALARTLHEHPRLNRFVAGRRLYQRDGVWVSFTVKKSMKPGAPLSVVKRRFEPDETLAQFAQSLADSLASARSDKPSYTDRETDLLLAIPRPILMGLVRVVDAADFLGLLPAAFIRNDPFFASAFVTNLGSVGGGAAYHHLYEYGNIPVFGTMGRVADEVVARDGTPAVRKVARIKYSYDERIEDGFNAVRGLTRLKDLLEAPGQLADETVTPAAVGSRA